MKHKRFCGINIILKRSKKIFFVMLFTAALMASMLDFWLLRQVVVSFDIETDSASKVNLFYTLDANSIFNDNESVGKEIPATFSKTEIVIPEGKLRSFRLEFGSNIKNAVISEIKIEGRKTLVLKDFKNVVFSKDINEVKIKDNKAFLDGIKQGAFILYSGDQNFKGHKKVDFCIFIILFVLSWLISYKIVFWMAKLKVIQKKSRIDIVFLFTFFALLFIPMLKISDKYMSAKENRVLAKYVPLFSNNRLNSNYGNDFNNWFNDRFLGRDNIIKYNTLLFDKINGVRGNKSVFVGESDWLFFKGDNSIKNYQNANLLTDDELKLISEYLVQINDWANKNNKKFYYVICPDKNKIYGEFIKGIRKIRKNEDGRTNQLVRYLRENTNVKVVYLYDTMNENKSKGLLYWKNDTHWNELGAYLGYKKIMELIKKDFQVKDLNILNFVSRTNPKGDLTKLLNTDKEDNTSEYLVPEVEDKSVCDSSVDMEIGSVIKCKSPAYSKLRLVVYRDSFSNNLKRYFNNTFKNVDYIWRYNITNEDKNFIKNNADIIILENVERYIPQLSSLKFPSL